MSSECVVVSPVEYEADRDSCCGSPLGSLLACPHCHGSLDLLSGHVRCRFCETDWPRGVRGVPLFTARGLSEQRTSGERLQLSRGGLSEVARRLMTPPTFGLDLATDRCMKRLNRELRQAGSQRPILNVGSGARLSAPLRHLSPAILKRTVHWDVSPEFDLVDLVADAGNPWPIRTGSVDAVIASAMMYYLADPVFFATEVQRVLAPGGWLYVTVPMLQPRMEPFDCTRWTVQGLGRLFSSLDVVESGPTAGPATVFGRTLMEFFAMVSSLGCPRLWGVARSFWGWLLWPIKYVDLVLMRHPRSDILASAVYLMAQKPKETRPESCCFEHENGSWCE